MKKPDVNKVIIVELSKDYASSIKLDSSYVADHYYAFLITCRVKGWEIKLHLKPCKKTLKKKHVGSFFEKHVEELRAFAAMLNNEQIG
ncbi:MAG: hypothetical protein QHH24_04285 [Candidatus Bathyarchaeota archaeon]|jgi:hypothetical protein|nr:hypothetical protein [Candidatus Bathyarchaeota archaeon]